MRIYTKSGDSGQTGLVGGSRIAKNSARICAIGEVDELNSAVGIARVEAGGSDIESWLAELQNRIFDLGAELATPEDSRFSNTTLSSVHIAWLESSIDEQTAALPPLKNFILPGGTKLGAQLHFARSVCRRAERSVLSLSEETTLRPELLIFLNRLSDWLFVTARTANLLSSVKDIEWSK